MKSLIHNSCVALTVLGLWSVASTPVVAGGFTLSSTDFHPNRHIAHTQVFNGGGCTGDNISPALKWENAPTGTKSFAILVHDPDAPTGGSGWWHWLVVNLPATITSLPANAGRTDGTGLPNGAQQFTTDFGTVGYGGPCPPVGDRPHRYHFTIYALKVERLAIPAGANAATVGFMVNANAIGKTTLTGLYGRK